MRKLLALFIIVVLTLVAGLCWSGIPQKINYQGMLTDDAGQPLDGSFELTFRIFNDSTTGNEQWAETQYDVLVTDGLFNVNLGDSVSIDLPFDENYWLEVVVDGTDTLLPRLMLTSVGYAYRAIIADSAVVAMSADSGGGWVDDGATVRLADSTNSVGIGTSSPEEKLTLAYDSYIGWEYGSGSSNVKHKIGKSSDGVGPLEFVTTFNPGPTGTLFSFINQDDGKHLISMLYNGNVGIGNSYPLFDLHVGQSSSTNQRVQIEGLTVIRTNGAGQPTNLRLANLNGSANSGASIDFQGLNSGSLLKDAARISGFLIDQTSTSEEGALGFFTIDVGDDGLAERMRIDKDGNVGVGTTSPGAKLDVYYDNTNSNSAAITIDNGTGPPRQDVLDFRFGGVTEARIRKATNSELFIGTVINQGIRFQTNATNRMAITNTGMVGIGTLSPGAGLVVSGGGDIYNPAIGIENTDGDMEWRLVVHDDSTFRVVKLSGSTLVPLAIEASNGHVGVGTVTPQGALDVSSTTGAFIVPRMTITQRDALTAVNGMIIYNTSTNQFNFYENGSWVTK
ncbi:MAG: hypothetical protein WBD28_11400 [Candidatus Zixiibacteriota bacterium]